MTAQQAIEILKQLDPNTEVALTIGAHAPVVPPPLWPNMPQHSHWWQSPPPYTVTCKHETQTTQTSEPVRSSSTKTKSRNS